MFFDFQCDALAVESQHVFVVSINLEASQCSAVGSKLGELFLNQSQVVQDFFIFCRSKNLEG